MEVIGHENVRARRTAKALGWFCEVFEEEALVLLGTEAGLTFVAALDDVDGQANNQKAGLTKHSWNYATELHALSMGSVPICPTARRVRASLSINPATLEPAGRA